MVQHDDFPAARLGRQLGLQPFVLFRTRCIVDIGVKAINVRNTVSKVVPRLVVGQVKVVVVQLGVQLVVAWNRNDRHLRDERFCCEEGLACSQMNP